MNHRVFVYGSLRREQCSHHLLAEATFCGTAQTEAAYTLLAISWYPGLITGGHTAVQGEVYEVSPDALPALDAYEGEGFVRQSIRLQDHSEALAWLARPEITGDGTPIPSGDWSTYEP